MFLDKRSAWYKNGEFVLAVVNSNCFLRVFLSMLLISALFDEAFARCHRLRCCAGRKDTVRGDIPRRLGGGYYCVR